MKRIILIFLMNCQMIFCAGSGPGAGPAAEPAAGQMEQKEIKAEALLRQPDLRNFNEVGGYVGQAGAGMVATIMDEKHPVNQELIKNIRALQGVIRSTLQYIPERQQVVADLIVNKGANPLLLAQIRKERADARYLNYNVENMINYAIKTGNLELVKKLIGIELDVLESRKLSEVETLESARFFVLGWYLSNIMRAFGNNDPATMDQIIDYLIREFKKRGLKFNESLKEKSGKIWFGHEGQFFLDYLINSEFWNWKGEDLGPFMRMIIKLMRHGARSAGPTAIRNPEIREKVQQLQAEIDAENEARAKAVRTETSLPLPNPLRELILQYEGSVEPTPEEETVAEPLGAGAAAVAVQPVQQPVPAVPQEERVYSLEDVD